MLSYSQLEVDHIRKYELDILVRDVKKIVSELCSLSEDSTFNYLTESDIQVINHIWYIGIFQNAAIKAWKLCYGPAS